MNKEEFARLEQLIDTLIDKYSSLKDKCLVLEQKLRDSEDERELLKMELAELQEQHSEVGRRVSGLLGRIEQWESERGFGDAAKVDTRVDTKVGRGEEENNEISDSVAPVAD
ncbi:MAG: cell division protein ZapB [Candidatus Electrothrix sp. LOE2]|jgi:FtsZ-binding cell division protein ZapB|nr:cell division protein ZapB [Candidatus Electrothrix sp. LOE2]